MMDLNRLSELLPEQTLACEYLRHINREIEENLCAEEYAGRWRKIIEEHRQHIGKYFLSVVMRTQGRRPEALREALLCLFAQDDQDFEVLLIGHKLDENQLSLVEDILAEQEPRFRERIRFLPFNEGNRTTPLNYGFAQANGEYIMIFDDDDLVMEDCVSAYRKQAEKTPGRVLYRYTVSQKWCVIDTDSGVQALRAQDMPEMGFCKDYDPLEQVYMNHCPPIGLAFPAFAFRDLGIIFDETLATTEDWDYLNRTVKYCGAASVNTVGAVYRLWTNAESSATVHAQEEWKENYHIIQGKMNSAPLLLPTGTTMRISDIVEMGGFETKEAAQEKQSLISRLQGELNEAKEYMKKCETDIALLHEHVQFLETRNVNAEGQRYIRKLEADIQELREYAIRLENSSAAVSTIAKHDAKRVYMALRRIGGKVLRKLGLRK